MARFENKEDLKNAAVKTYDKLKHLISEMSIDTVETPFTYDISNEKGAHWSRDKNIRDVLIHVYEWHVLIMNWIKANESGLETSFLPKPYNWKTYGDMNMEVWKKHQSTPLIKAKALLEKSHEETVCLIDRIDENKLFAKDTYAGGSTIGQYFISTTVGHYDWAIKKIKKHIINLR